MLKQRLVYLTLLLGAAVFYLFYWEYIAFAALMLVAALPVFSGLILLGSSLFIQTRLRAAAPVVTLGAPAVLRLELQNRGFFAITAAQVTLRLENAFVGEASRERIVLPVSASNVTTVELDAISNHCGRVEVTVERVRLYDFFCLFSLSKKPCVRAETAVIPELFELFDSTVSPPGEQEECQSYSTQKPGDDPSQIFDYHEYRDGDKLKNIHWKLSARLDRLMVKEYSLPLSSDACIAWELCGRSVEPLQADLLAGACASLSAFLAKNGAPHTVEWFSKRHGRVERETAPADPLDLLLQIFSAGRAEVPCLLTDILGRPGAPAYARLIYLTAVLTEETSRQLTLLRTAAPVYVIYAAPLKAGELVLVEKLASQGVPVTVLRDSLCLEDFFEQAF